MHYQDLNEIIGKIKLEKNYLEASWPAPLPVKTLISTRLGGFSKPPYASLNLALHVGDDIDNVQKNRDYIQNEVPIPIVYLNQIHSNLVVEANEDSYHNLISADALFETQGKMACAILTADCLPILLCNQAGNKVAAIHAGWRGLANGIIETTLQKLSEPGEQLMVYLGPAISQDAFEVKQDAVSLFVTPILQKYKLESCFNAIGDDTYLTNLYAIAKKILNYHGVTKIYGGNFCTVLHNQYFYSYRKEKQTGRIGSIIWLENAHN